MITGTDITFDDQWCLGVSSGSPFALAGTPIASDAFVTEAVFDQTVGPNAGMGPVYSGQFADDASDNSIKANLKWRFRGATRRLLAPAVLTAVVDFGEHAHDAPR